MKYDKDIRIGRLIFTIIGASLLMVTAWHLFRRQWDIALASGLWVWACWRMRASLCVQQETPAKRAKLEPIMHAYILAERVWGATPEMHETLKAAGAEILATPEIANCPPMPLAIKRATEINPNDVPYALGLFLGSSQLALFRCAADKLAKMP